MLQDNLPFIMDTSESVEPSSIAKLITDHAADGIFLLDHEGRTTFANPAGEAMFGWRAEELKGRKLHDVIHHHYPDGRPFEMSACPLGTVFVSGESLRNHDDLFFHRDGHEVPVACSNAAIVQDGVVVGSVLIVSDNSRRVEAEQHRRLLLDELNHRVKNVLSIVQALSEQTLSSPDFLEARNSLSARIRALADAQDLLIAGGHDTAAIKDLLERALLPFGSAERVTKSGPEIMLPPSLATNLSMAVHELATNALKYGALSNQTGTVQIDWSVRGNEQDRLFSFTWQERGGPPVTPPKGRGFGSKMIERVLAAEFGGTAKLTFHTDGLVCSFTAPLGKQG